MCVYSGKLLGLRLTLETTLRMSRVIIRFCFVGGGPRTLSFCRTGLQAYNAKKKLLKTGFSRLR